MTHIIHTSQQRGATLVIAMIMLILATLFVLAAINMSSTNLLVIGNQQARNEAIQAAQQVIEQVASKDFTTDPTAAVSFSPATVDVAGGGKTGYSVAVSAPVCLNSIPLKSKEFQPSSDPNSDDFRCTGSGRVGAPGSICSATNWDLSATATDPANSTGTQVTLHQGISKRVLTGLSPC